MGGEAAGDGVSVSFECAGEGEGQVTSVGIYGVTGTSATYLVHLSHTSIRQTRARFLDNPRQSPTSFQANFCYIRALVPGRPGRPFNAQLPPLAPTQTTMATDYDFSDEFASAQPIPPGRDPILIEHNPPPPLLPPQRPSLQSLPYLAIPPHLDQRIPGFVFGIFILAFFHDCSVLIIDCCHRRRVKLRSVVSPVLCAVIVFVIGRGMWDVAMLKDQLGEAQRQLWQVQENLLQCLGAPPLLSKTTIRMAWVHDGE